MMSIDEMRILLQDRNLKTVADRAHVSYWSLSRFVRGDTGRPDYHMIEAVKQYLRDQGISGNPVD